MGEVRLTRFPLPPSVPGSRRMARWLAIRGLAGLTPVIVYQMAKVGSSAVVGALTRSGLAVYHVHRMSARHLEQLRAGRAALEWRIPPIPVQDRVGLDLYDRVIAPRRAARVVTLVRNPIARNLSSYFEHLDFIWNTANAHAAVPLDELCAGFLQRYTHTEPLTWFDDELQPVLGVDVYGVPFPAAGHVTIRGGTFDVLILKSEAADEVKRGALSEYLGIDVAPLQRTNITGETPKGKVYREFLRRLRFTPAYVDELLNARYTRHFYSEAERAEMRKRCLDR